MPRALALLVLLLSSLAAAQAPSAFDAMAARARGQTVYWNAWAGDDRTNAFIGWVAGNVEARYGIKLVHVRLKDTAEAVTRVIAEKAAGRTQDGSVDLVWLNGPNFLALKGQGLLYGPFVAQLPAARYIDTTHIRSNVVDFTVPVDGYAAPWRRAQIVFVYDSARVPEPPRSAIELLQWARAHPGRTTHPNVRNFLGATFFKQVLYELAPEPAALQQPVNDATFATQTAPLWRWYDALRPLLWRRGEQFPDSGPAMRQLMNDGEIDFMVSFNPAEAAVAGTAGLLPQSARTVVFRGGTIGNTSFVAIPFNASHKEAAMVVADFLLEPATQARAQDFHEIGSFTVLDMSKLDAAQARRFDELPKHPALPDNAQLSTVLPEPHPSWMLRLTAEWERRYTR